MFKLILEKKSNMLIEIFLACLIHLAIFAIVKSFSKTSFRTLEIHSLFFKIVDKQVSFQFGSEQYIYIVCKNMITLLF